MPVEGRPNEPEDRINRALYALQQMDTEHIYDLGRLRGILEGKIV